MRSEQSAAKGTPIVPVERRNYLIFLAGLIALQTLARLTLRVRPRYETWIPTALHLSLVAVTLVIIILIVSRLPMRWRGRAVAAPAAVLLLGTAHMAITVFDLWQYGLRHYAAMDAPAMLLFTDPGMLMALLGTIDIGPGTIALVVIPIWIVHLLLYAPVANQLAELAHNVAGATLPLGRTRRLPVVWLMLCYLVFFALLSRYGPPNAWAQEVIHRGSARNFQMAPPELLMSAGDPPAKMLPKANLPGARPLILIIVDAMRRDRMALYDPAMAPTPFLSGLQKQGDLRVYNSFSTCTFSACGIMSVLASRSWDDFGRRPPTVIDALSRYSYRPYVLLAGKDSSFALLVELYGVGVKVRDQSDRKASNDDRLIEMLRDTDFPDPNHSFLYMHLASTHAGSFVRPEFRIGAGELGVRAEKHVPSAYGQQYDRRVSQADQVIRDIFAVLKEKGLLTNALVIITADHGERIGEHGLYYHGGPADGPTTTTPLIIYDPTHAAFPDRAFTSAIDIAPTFLRAVGGDALPGWRGHALQDAAWPGAVPLGTFETTGVVAMLPDGQYRYLCDRDTGDEHVVRLDGTTEGVKVRDRAALAGLLPRLRAIHRTISEPPAGLCRR